MKMEPHGFKQLKATEAADVAEAVEASEDVEDSVGKETAAHQKTTGQDLLHMKTETAKHAAQDMMKANAKQKGTPVKDVEEGTTLPKCVYRLRQEDQTLKTEVAAHHQEEAQTANQELMLSQCQWQ